MHRALLIAPALLLVAAAPADGLPAALAQAWTARGVRFTPAAVTARIGGRTGVAALLAVAGATAGADGEEVETAVELAWVGGAATPAWPLLGRDTARGFPGVALAKDGRWWLVDGVTDWQVTLRDPLGGGMQVVDRADLLLIGRPLIAGA